MTNVFYKTDANLRKLLNSIYDTNELVTFEALVESYFSAFCFRLDCFLYIREKAWFSDKKTTQDPFFLRFQYLSFEILDNSHRRFDSSAALVDRETELLAAGYNKDDESRLCCFLYKPVAEYDLTRIVNLTKRIFVGFYKNCGSYDHFRESVAQRFIREYYLLEPRLDDVDTLIKYICQRTGLSLSLWQQKDEMFFHKDTHPSSLLLPIHPSKHATICPPISDDNAFQADLKTSVTKKNQTFGQTQCGLAKYVINTFSSHYFSQGLGHVSSAYKSQQRAVAIYISRNRPICLDSVYLSNRLIDYFLNTNDEVQQSGIWTKASKSCVAQEQRIGSKPIYQKHDLDDVIKVLIDDILHDVLSSTRAEVACFRMFDPFSCDLMPFSVVFDGDAKQNVNIAKVSIADRKALCAKVFHDELSMDLLHPEKVRQDIELSANKSASRKLDELDRELRERMSFVDCFGRYVSAVYATPILKGDMKIGVLEFSSSESGRLSLDIEFFNMSAMLCGDIIRRIELANDRAWLARMSFIHAARHRIEALLRELTDQNRAVAGEIVQLMNPSSSMPGVQKAAEHFSLLIARISNALVECKDNVGSMYVLDELERINKISVIPARSCTVIADIFDTLVSNASHSSFLPSHVDILRVGTPGGRAYIKVTYVPKDIRLEKRRMDQICLAPIPDDTTPTYHYGLFLLSAQLRMMGGAACGKAFSDDGLGNSDFGVSFLVPV